MNGQEFILGPETKCVFIAGMGGKEIMDILIHLAPQLTSNDKVVISPHRNLLELRKFLNGSEFGLIDEICIKENAQFYQILGIKKSPSLPKIPVYGEKLWKDEVGREYLRHQMTALKSHQDPQTIAFLEYLSQLSD